MTVTGNRVPYDLKCTACGGQLIETGRENHPRLPAHELRAYACHACGAQEQLNAPLPLQKGTP